MGLLKKYLETDIMKVINQILFITLMLSLILSVGTVMAVDDIPFNQSELKVDSTETENVISQEDDSEYDNSENQAELDTKGVVMSDDEYSCGAASFATVVNNLGKNITLNEAKHATNTTINGTSMNNMVNAAKKYNLTAYALNIGTNNLKENYIIHMNIIGVDHWSVVKTLTNESIILADPNLGNYKYDLLEFNQYYTNNSVIITKSVIGGTVNEIIPIGPNFISEIGQKCISGKGYDYYISKTLGYVDEKPKGPVIRYTIVVPKWVVKILNYQRQN